MSECRKRAAILVADVVGSSRLAGGGRGAHARAAAPAAQNDDYGADSGPSQGDPGGRAIRPIGESEAAVRYVRCTSIRDGRSNVANAQIAVIAPALNCRRS
jgi:hypothetical protein